MPEVRDCNSYALYFNDKVEGPTGYDHNVSFGPRIYVTLGPDRDGKGRVR